MIRVHQLVRVSRACLRPGSPQTLIGVSAYCAYLAFLSIREIEALGDTAYVHLCVSLATAGAWIGVGVGRAATWPGAAFTPAYIPALGVVATQAVVLALGLNGAAAWIGGLDPWPLTTFGLLAAATGLASGRAQPALTSYLVLCLVILVPCGPLLGSAPLPIHGAESAVASVLAIAAAAAILVWFAFRLRAPGVTSRSPSALGWFGWPTAVKLLTNRLREPSIRRIAVMSGTLAAVCTYAHRLGGLDWRDGPLIVLVATVCAHLGATGTSASLHRGTLPATAWLLLSGVAKTRTDAARPMLWAIVADSMFAAGVFTAVTIVLGPDWHLVEMMLVALAACHAYLVAACPSRWLLSSRLSAFVATPAVVATTWAAWDLVVWSLPTAITACVLSGVAAVYLGGIGMGRIDLDPVPATEPAS